MTNTKYVAYDAYQNRYVPIKEWAAKRVLQTDDLINGNLSMYEEKVNARDGEVFLVIKPSQLEEMLKHKN